VCGMVGTSITDSPLGKQATGLRDAKQKNIDDLNKGEKPGGDFYIETQTTAGATDEVGNE
ncbi:MAG: hypothetical protein V1751_05450, partial [Pseudomonadota bacterium]